jgi:hypothetical protein
MRHSRLFLLLLGFIFSGCHNSSSSTPPSDQLNGSCASGCGTNLICGTDKLCHTCIFGEKDCPCDAGTCKSDFSCSSDNICVACAAGTQDCACNSGSCGDGLRCDATHICKTCVDGDEGCACANESCGTNLTCNSEHLCVKSQVTGTPPSLKFPDNPKCYTPCQKSIVKQDGGLASCAPDGLIDGCLDGLACVRGSCVQAGEGPRTCNSETDCPQYQGCFEGFCAANCSQDSDCTEGLKCANKVCRTPCSVTSATCGTQQFCSTLDGTNGFCAQFLPREDDKKPAISGSFAVSETPLMFNPLSPSASFVITNESLTSQSFVVARAEELGTLSNGLRTSVGDDVGRLYLVQRGTGIVRRIEDGQKVYFALPQRVAVINTSFNGRKTLDPGVYRNDFLRDRPVLNTSWDLLFNQKDEIANQDIELNSLSDIRLYIYYTDFTAL